MKYNIHITVTSGSTEWYNKNILFTIQGGCYIYSILMGEFRGELPDYFLSSLNRQIVLLKFDNK